MMNNKVIHFGAGNIGRGLIAELASINNLDILFVDVSKDLIDKINKEKKYAINCLPSNKKITIDNCKGLNLINQKDELIDLISKADMVTTSIGVNNLINLCEIINSSLEKRTNQNKLVIACFENGFKASEYLFEKIIEKNNANLSKLDFVNVVVDRLVPDQSNDSLDVNVEDFYSVWYKKNNNSTTWLFNLNTTSIDGKYEDFFNKKFYGVNGLHFSIAMIGYSKKMKYINETINDKECLSIINNLIEEMSVAISSLTNLDLKDIEQYLKNNVERFSNKYLLDDIDRVARNAKQKISDNERILPMYKWLIENKKQHDTFNEILKIANKYIEEKGVKNE
ncbi:mannitol dehydrogenase family protein [Malacoplasma iowae]|nr:hypothetical protein QX180_01025 [Malacoplasma iowae]